MTPASAQGSAVVVFLHSPKERVWGMLREQDPSGIWLQGIDLASFEDWARQIGRNDELSMGLSMVFYPMLRVEKILLDRGTPGQPSMSDRFRELAGRPLEQYLASGTGAQLP